MKFQPQNSHQNTPHEHGRAESDPLNNPQERELQTADRMLRNAQMINAPTGFADRVMANILAGKLPKPELKLRWFGFLMLLTLFASILLGGAALTGQLNLVGAIAFFVAHQVVVLVNGISVSLYTGVVNVLAVLNPLNITPNTVSVPLLVVLLGTAASVSGMWLWFLSYTTARRQQVVYRIPVRVAQY
jgi:hypothetical protein